MIVSGLPTQRAASTHLRRRVPLTRRVTRLPTSAWFHRPIPVPRPAQPARRVKRSILLSVALAAVLVSGCREKGSASPALLHDIGLFTSLPILWNEHGQVADFVKSPGQEHWAAGVIGQHGNIRALDRMAPIPADVGVIVMAQPRPLSPDENVALDDWVRAGGRLLLFADPMLTQGSVFALGDKRRPEGTVLLSPILARWGLTLHFDDAQAAGPQEVEVFGQAVPVDLPGTFRLSQGEGNCRLYAGGLVAECSVGKGKVLAVADAALLEPQPSGDAGERAAILGTFLARTARD